MITINDDDINCTFFHYYPSTSKPNKSLKFFNYRKTADTIIIHFILQVFSARWQCTFFAAFFLFTKSKVITIGPLLFFNTDFNEISNSKRRKKENQKRVLENKRTFSLQLPSYTFRILTFTESICETGRQVESRGLLRL